MVLSHFSNSEVEVIRSIDVTKLSKDDFDYISEAEMNALKKISTDYKNGNKDEFERVSYLMYRLIPRKSVIKFIEKRTPKEKSTIVEKLKILKLNPYPNDFLDIKKLSNSEYYRLRINNYRFVYEIIENELVILMVQSDNRGDIY